MSDRTDIKVFIASSGDLKEERDESVKVIVELNKNYSHLHLEPVLFELDTASGNILGKKRIQDGINPLLDLSDIVVVIFYSRIGEFTKEEFSRAIEQGKKVFLFLKEGFKPDTSEKIKKYAEVIELKETVEKESEIRYQLFDTAKNYNGLLYKDLDKYLKKEYLVPGPKGETADAGKLHDSNSPNIEPVKVYIEKLPLYSSDLIGREEELKMLDEAWEKHNSNIVVLKAGGGVGKTALTGHWLIYHLQPRNYAGAKWVYAWSFYSQGASEGSQPSADPFIDDALKFFEVNPIPAIAYDKARKLAEVIGRNRGLLIIDGLEPLQYPASEIASKEKRTGLEGELKDNAMQVLLKQLAAYNEGLCIISTRLELKTLQNFKGATVRLHDLNQLSPEAGAELLKTLGVKGKDAELIGATKDLKGHALTLKLFANLLREYFDGDIRKRDRIKDLTDDTQEGGHAWRVMTGYLNYISKAELSLQYLIGLFDRPARLEVLNKMIYEKAAPEITAILNKTTREQLKQHVHHLERLGLLLTNEYENLPVGLSYQCLKGLERYESLDAHPLVREYFGRRLQTQHPATYQQANLFLYEYYESMPEKELPDTLIEMEPLFLAVAHGCRAGKQQEAYSQVYRKRVLRNNKYHLNQGLGAYGSDLACLSNFFEKVWDIPAIDIIESTKSVLFSMAGFDLRALGRFDEAAQAMEAGKEMSLKQDDWVGAAIDAGNISELYLISGDVAQAVAYGKLSVEYADKSRTKNEMIDNRTIYAYALYQHNETDKSFGLFAEAEEMQQKYDNRFLYLYSVRGYKYCNLLLNDNNKVEVVIIRAKEGLKGSEENNWLLDRALNKLSLGNAYLAKNILSFSKTGKGLEKAKHYFDQAIEDLRKAGGIDDIPLGLFDRAAYFRATGYYVAAEKDLREALEIAEYGNMKLYYVDYHIEKMKLSKAQGNLTEAEEHRQIAKEWIEKTGYLRRSKEVETI